MSTAEELKLFNELTNKGCCKRCILRYLGICKTLITFEYPDACLVNFGFISAMDEFLESPKCKMKRSNPCAVCLGLLQDPILEKMLLHENLKKIDKYGSQTFVVYITFPTCILVRDHSMKVYLKKMFPECFDVNKVIKINHAWRYSIENRLCQILNKTYDHLSKLTLHYYTDYLLEDEEMSVVRSFVQNQKRKESLSKHCVTALLESIPDGTFENLITVPPRVPLYEVTSKELKYFSEAIYLIGNYCKYSRQLHQIPHIINKEVVVEYSIETILLNSLKCLLGNFKEIIFKASSFDEQNVRVLGNGRTFHLQINDPSFDSVSHKMCRKIEKQIKSTKEVIVKNLRQADKRDIFTISDSERLSPKSYKLLCIVYSGKNIDYCVNAVNMYTDVSVQQKTPIRLLHQRPWKNKKKKIFYIRATKIINSNNLIEIDICAECGLCIPEFINGDFGRTRPSLEQMINAKVDLLAIDVVDFSTTLPCAADEEEVVI